MDVLVCSSGPTRPPSWHSVRYHVMHELYIEKTIKRTVAVAVQLWVTLFSIHLRWARDSCADVAAAAAAAAAAALTASLSLSEINTFWRRDRDITTTSAATISHGRLGYHHSSKWVYIISFNPLLSSSSPFWLFHSILFFYTNCSVRRRWSERTSLIIKKK